MCAICRHELSDKCTSRSSAANPAAGFMSMRKWIESLLCVIVLCVVFVLVFRRDRAGIDCALSDDASLETCIVVWGMCST